MPDSTPRRLRAGQIDHRNREPAQEATIAREQAPRPVAEPDARTLTEKENERPTMKLADGSEVDAHQAAGIHQRLCTLLTVAPDEVRSLLALAIGQPENVDPRHYGPLWAEACLENDRLTIRPEVRAVLINSYAVTHEGLVIAPLRLHGSADKSVADQAERQRDRQFDALWASIVDRKGKGPSKG